MVAVASPSFKKEIDSVFQPNKYIEKGLWFAEAQIVGENHCRSCPRHFPELSVCPEIGITAKEGELDTLDVVCVGGSFEADLDFLHQESAGGVNLEPYLKDLVFRFHGQNGDLFLGSIENCSELSFGGVFGSVLGAPLHCDEDRRQQQCPFD